MLQQNSPQPRQLATTRQRRRPLISLTPLIDVVFILLIFFMLASSFQDWRTIDLSAPAQAGAGNAMEGALLVEVRPQGLRLGGQPVSRAALAAQVKQRIAESPERKVLVQAAQGVPLQRAVDILDLLAATGAADLSLIRASER